MEKGKITHEAIDEAMARFFAKGGKIDKIESASNGFTFESYEDMLLDDYMDSNMELKELTPLV
jgi:hypothetical protein